MAWLKDFYNELVTLLNAPALTIEYDRKNKVITLTLENKATTSLWMEEQKNKSHDKGNISLSESQMQENCLSFSPAGALSNYDQTNEKSLDATIDKALWEFRAISAGVLPQQIVERDSEYHYSISEDRSNVDRWIREQKLKEQKNYSSQNLNNYTKQPDDT